MKPLFALALLSLNLVAQTTTNSATSGLQIVEITFTKKFVREEGLSGGVVSHDPPVLDDSTIMIPRPRSGKPTIANKNQKAAISGRRVGAYDFHAQIKNDGVKPITGFVWVYTIPPLGATQETVAQEYLCRVRIEPGETKAIKVRSPIPQPRTVDISDATKPPAEHQPVLSDMSVNQIEFADGTLWRRDNWNPVVLTRLGARRLAKGKCIAF